MLDAYECLVGESPVVKVSMGGVKFSCLLDTGSNVSTVIESFFREQLQPKWGQKLADCGWLSLSGANGLEIPYIGYFEVDIEAVVLNKTIPRRGVLVVMDPISPAARERKRTVPGLIGMNVIKTCYELSFP